MIARAARSRSGANGRPAGIARPDRLKTKPHPGAVAPGGRAGRQQDGAIANGLERIGRVGPLTGGRNRTGRRRNGRVDPERVGATGNSDNKSARTDPKHTGTTAITAKAARRAGPKSNRAMAASDPSHAERAGVLGASIAIRGIVSRFPAM